MWRHPLHRNFIEKNIHKALSFRTEDNRQQEKSLLCHGFFYIRDSLGRTSKSLYPFMLTTRLTFNKGK